MDATTESDATNKCAFLTAGKVVYKRHGAFASTPPGAARTAVSGGSDGCADPAADQWIVRRREVRGHAERLARPPPSGPMRPRGGTGRGRSPARSRSARGGRRSPGCRRAAAGGRRRASSGAARWPQAVRLPYRPGPYQVARRTRIRAQQRRAASAGRRRRPPASPASRWKRRTAAPVAASKPPVSLEVAVAAGARGSPAECARPGPSLPSLQHALAELRPWRAVRLRRRCRRRRAPERRRVSPREVVAATQDQEDRRAAKAHAATRSGREPGDRVVRRRAPAARLRAARRCEAFGHVPLFPALTGLADGLALKELRYAGSSHDGSTAIRPCGPRAALVPPLPGAHEAARGDSAVRSVLRSAASLARLTARVNRSAAC